MAGVTKWEQEEEITERARAEAGGSLSSWEHSLASYSEGQGFTHITNHLLLQFQGIQGLIWLPYALCMKVVHMTMCRPNINTLKNFLKIEKEPWTPILRNF